MTPHAKAEFREMRLRRMPRPVRAMAHWYLRHNLTLKVAVVALAFVLANNWQHEEEIRIAGIQRAKLERKVAELKTFASLTDKTFVVRANSMIELEKMWQEIEIAASQKRAETMAMRVINEEGR